MQQPDHPWTRTTGFGAFAVVAVGSTTPLPPSGRLTGVVPITDAHRRPPPPLGRRRYDRISGGILKTVVPARFTFLRRRLPEKR